MCQLRTLFTMRPTRNLQPSESCRRALLQEQIVRDEERRTSGTRGWCHQCQSPPAAATLLLPLLLLAALCTTVQVRAGCGMPPSLPEAVCYASELQDPRQARADPPAHPFLPCPPSRSPDLQAAAAPKPQYSSLWGTNGEKWSATGRLSECAGKPPCDACKVPQGEAAAWPLAAGPDTKWTGTATAAAVLPLSCHRPVLS